MQNLKPIIAKNISNLRQENNMTQNDLASKLNYSDKAVSKWERAESIPDIAVLKQISDLFNVSLDYLVTDNSNESVSNDEALYSEAGNCETEHVENNYITTVNDNITNNKTETTPKSKFTYMSSPLRKHGFITGMSIILVWLVATLAFVIVDIITSKTILHWLSFVYAIPISAIVWLVFNSMWFNKRRNYFIISLLMWSTLLAIVLSLICFGGKMALILILGIPGQIIIYMWSNLKKKVKITETSSYTK